MRIFCFASKNVENIRRGIAARRWAVANVSSAAMAGRVTKARKYFKLGSKGLLYCRETHSFTTPFITESSADPLAVVCDVWPEAWVLPFDIRPLGDLSKQMPADRAKLVWPFLAECGSGGVTAAMNATGVTVFVPKEISDEDWSTILSDLGCAN